MTKDDLIASMNIFKDSGGNEMDFEVQTLDGSIIPVKVELVVQRFDVPNQRLVMSVILEEVEE